MPIIQDYSYLPQGYPRRPVNFFGPIIDAASQDEIDSALLEDDDEFGSGLGRAARFAASSVFQLLIAKASPIAVSQALKKVSKDGVTAITFVAEYQASQSLIALIEKASPEAISESLAIVGSMQWSALCSIVIHQDAEVLKALFQKAPLGIKQALHVQCKGKNDFSCTPFFLISRYQNPEIFREVLAMTDSAAIEQDIFYTGLMLGTVGVTVAYQDYQNILQLIANVHPKTIQATFANEASIVLSAVYRTNKHLTGEQRTAVYLLVGRELLLNSMAHPRVVDVIRQRYPSAPNFSNEFNSNASLDRLGNTYVHYYVAHNNLAGLEKMAEKSANFNQANYAEVTPLQLALAMPQINFQLLRALVQGGANPNALNLNGQPLLHMAITNRWPILVIQELLKLGLRIDVTNDQGETALAMLLNQPYQTSYFGRGPAEIITYAEFLVANGADINTTNKDGNTWAHIAANAGDTITYRRLVEEFHANPELLNRSKETATQLNQQRMQRQEQRVPSIARKLGGWLNRFDHQSMPVTTSASTTAAVRSSPVAAAAAAAAVATSTTSHTASSSHSSDHFSAHALTMRGTFRPASPLGTDGETSDQHEPSSMNDMYNAL